MTSHVVVCPGHLPLLEKLQSRAVVIDTEDAARLPEIFGSASRHVTVQAVRLRLSGPLANAPWNDDWRAIPLLVEAPELGSIRKVMELLPLLRRLRLRVYLSSGGSRNPLDVQRLASLGIASGIVFDSAECDWEALNDLMHWSLYSRGKRAPVEPFFYLTSRYDPAERATPGGACFDDFRRYLYINADEHIALTREGFANNEFIAQGIDGISRISVQPGYRDAMAAWLKHFEEFDSCARCPGWRLCCGYFSRRPNGANGCSALFSALLDAAEIVRHKANNGDQAPLWPL